MAHRGVCPDMACELIRKRIQEHKTKRDCYKAIAKELGVPWRTVQSWDGNSSRGNSISPPPYEKIDCCTISDLDKLIKKDIRFGTIYADPPWKYENQATRSATSGIYRKDEWCMTLDELANLPIAELSAEQAHLHLWTTNVFLPDALELIKTWGFEYKGVFVWVKPQIGMGNYWRVAHEFLLLGIKGGLRFYDKSQRSWLECKRGRHSAKPEKVRYIIEKTSPGPYLELFGRRVAKNWVVWGNEIERDLFYGKVE